MESSASKSKETFVRDRIVGGQVKSLSLGLVCRHDHRRRRGLPVPTCHEVSLEPNRYRKATAGNFTSRRCPSLFTTWTKFLNRLDNGGRWNIEISFMFSALIIERFLESMKDSLVYLLTWIAGIFFALTWWLKRIENNFEEHLISLKTEATT